MAPDASSEASLRTRRRLGGIGALIFTLFFAALLDSCIARFREPLFTVHLLPGGSEAVDGRLEHGMNDLARLQAETSDDRVRLRIDGLQSGFWLGGRMWVGSITAAADAEPGVYQLRVRALDQPPEAPPAAAYQAVVYPDPAALRRSRLSLFRRTFDVPPELAALACLPLLGIVLGLVYRLGRAEERRLMAQGRAEVFLAKTAPGGGVELYFGLGRRRGVAPGLRLRVYAKDGRPIGEAVVRQADDENGVAVTAEASAPALLYGAVVELPAPLRPPG